MCKNIADIRDPGFCEVVGSFYILLPVVCIPILSRFKLGSFAHIWKHKKPRQIDTVNI